MKLRPRQPHYVATAVLSLALWLFMAAAENWTPLHAWLHGGAIPDNDDCAVVSVAHGKIVSAACDIPVITPTTWVEVTPRVELSVFSTTLENLPPGRAPPALCIAS